MQSTLSVGMPSVAAMPSRTKCGFCEPDQQVAWPSLISTTAQAGPMQACDWNGHSYSASITRAAVLSATTARKLLSRTTRAPAMSLIEDSSTLTGVAPATGGRITRACTMPGIFTSVTNGAWANALGAMSTRLIG